MNHKSSITINYVFLHHFATSHLQLFFYYIPLSLPLQGQQQGQGTIPLGTAQMLITGDQVMSPFSRMQVRTDQRIIHSPIFYFPFFITISSDYNRTVLQ